LEFEVLAEELVDTVGSFLLKPKVDSQPKHIVPKNNATKFRTIPATAPESACSFVALFLAPSAVNDELKWHWLDERLMAR
jgi:hypothetical protein